MPIRFLPAEPPELLKDFGAEIIGAAQPRPRLGDPGEPLGQRQLAVNGETLVEDHREVAAGRQHAARTPAAMIAAIRASKA